jgi:prolyl-tRNA editing enzyme YbaK/EbsC (Cys-tRNA(Pro) deacylase)
MNTNLGKLNLMPTIDHSELMAESTFELIKKLPEANQIMVAEIDSKFSDTAEFCEYYEVSLEQTVNCIVLEAKRADRKWFASCAVLGKNRADINGIVRRTLDARRVSFAPMDEAVAQTKMEYGGITPIGLPSDWSILVDSTIVNLEMVVIGSGIRKSKLVLPGNLFTKIPNITIVENLGLTITQETK